MQVSPKLLQTTGWSCGSLSAAMVFRVCVLFGSVLRGTDTEDSGSGIGFTRAASFHTPAGTGNSYSIAYGVNDSGQIVGSTAGEAFLYSGGSLINITSGTAYAINASGEVAGVSLLNGQFCYANGQLSNLKMLPPK